MAAGTGAAVAAASLLAMQQSAYLVPMLVAAVVCGVAALVGLEPVRRLSKVGPERAVPACMLGMVLRLAVTLAGCALATMALDLPPRAVALWAMAFYLLVLVAEVRVLLRYFHSLTAPASVTPAMSEMR